MMNWWGMKRAGNHNLFRVLISLHRPCQRDNLIRNSFSNPSSGRVHPEVSSTSDSEPAMMVLSEENCESKQVRPQQLNAEDIDSSPTLVILPVALWWFQAGRHPCSLMPEWNRDEGADAFLSSILLHPGVMVWTCGRGIPLSFPQVSSTRDEVGRLW